MCFDNCDKSKVKFFRTKYRLVVEILCMLNSSLCEEKNRERLAVLARRLSRKFPRFYFDCYFRYLFRNRMMSK